MKEYQSWSFKDRSFALALGLSLLWHFFWFVSVTIVVSPRHPLKSSHARLVSLGRVLDDNFFKTLVETRPQVSQTFYRHLSDFSPKLEPEVKTLERHSQGDVVSVPFGERFMSSLRGWVGGSKSSPLYEFTRRLPIRFEEQRYRLEGPLSQRQVLSRPDSEPRLPPGSDPALAFLEVEIQFSVDASGFVSEAEVTHSAGDPALDQEWMRYLRQWQFAPLASAKTGLEKGKIHFRLSKPSENR